MGNLHFQARQMVERLLDAYSILKIFLADNVQGGLFLKLEKHLSDMSLLVSHAHTIFNPVPIISISPINTIKIKGLQLLSNWTTRTNTNLISIKISYWRNFSCGASKKSLV